MACNRPKCKEARRKAQLKEGRGLPATPAPAAQATSDNTNQPAPSASPSNGVVVSPNNKKGIVQ